MCQLCSTPSGVEGSITPPRLSGSCGTWCSTPSGVEGSITSQAAAGPLRVVRVLNAFRRRRFHHGRRISRGRPPPRAQRLPASKVPSRAQPRALLEHPPRAQRLPASKVPSRRHRPQRPFCLECSTPSGVEGSITRDRRRRRDRRAVLNAFRRRRFHHPEVGDHLAEGLQQCSTPSGVEGSITARRGGGSSPGSSCAQRLPASKVPSPVLRSPRVTSSCRAQRLPASKVPSRPGDQAA